MKLLFIEMYDNLTVCKQMIDFNWLVKDTEQ